jgi:integrase
VRYGSNKGQFIFKAPKTQKSRRLVPISPSTCEVLRLHGEAQNKQRLALNLPAIVDSDLVFANWDGKPYQPNSITHAWVKLSKKHNLHGVRLHDLRHTMASWMLAQGVHPKIVQERLGHSSIQITLDTYSHVAPGLQQAAANKLDDVLKNNTPEVGIGSKRLVSN